MDPTTTPPPPPPRPYRAGDPLRADDPRRYAQAIRIYDQVKRPGRRVLTLPEIQRVIDAHEARDGIRRLGVSDASPFVPHDELGPSYAALAVLATIADPFVRMVERLIDWLRRIAAFLRWIAGVGRARNGGRS